jgi:hypothetical protein
MIPDTKVAFFLLMWDMGSVFPLPALILLCSNQWKSVASLAPDGSW